MSLDTDLIRRLTILEQRLDSLVFPEVSRWQDWTPTVTQSGSVTYGASLTRYITNGKIVVLQINLNITGTGTAANDIVIGNLPFNLPTNERLALGTGSVTDSGVATYVGTVEPNGAVTSVRIRSPHTNGVIGNNPSFALASGDDVSFTITYEKP